jgi:hypothetical protein
MKQIQPISIWYNGQMIPATKFNLLSITDNLSTSATFYYALYSTDNIKLNDGNLTMTDFDYQAYSTSPDSNSYAYSWAATKLNVTLV